MMPNELHDSMHPPQRKRNIPLGYKVKRDGFGTNPGSLGSVTARVPVYISRDDRFFQDTYQSMPLHGYTSVFRRTLAHPNIKVLLNCDFNELGNEANLLHGYDRRTTRLSL
jgi:UDP-galactopyranose mutase